MRFHLICHPTTSCAAVRDLEVDLRRSHENKLLLTYCMKVSPSEVVIPAPAEKSRADGLWQQTCFEAFFRMDEQAYLEFNFSPSGEWAAYSFVSYRKGMAQLDVQPEVDIGAVDEMLILRATIPPAFSEEQPQAIALSAVIEERGGNKSYWALAHPAAKPDFHHPDSFTHIDPAAY